MLEGNGFPFQQLVHRMTRPVILHNNFHEWNHSLACQFILLFQNGSPLCILLTQELLEVLHLLEGHLLGDGASSGSKIDQKWSQSSASVVLGTPREDE